MSGRQIEIKYRDDNTKADVGARGARELIQQDGVDVIVGVVSSGVGLAVSEACSQLGCPLVLSGTVSVRHGQGWMRCRRSTRSR